MTDKIHKTPKAHLISRYRSQTKVEIIRELKLAISLIIVKN